ncbi:hypothetical protein I7I50_07950 [Histoplasma capsulatum G186AR]|uniref:Uncharacterized protein n=1 Tax=Ajellomyces capsulatus TaxID=5037 RepID=A0A8H7YKG4_AJECA|nr:hypothetical protein I7I52_08466 [Histoplasma capsulatum]QSS68512.1 hypothetical protein I7I50_07950 [Histoplasma capsulatum G186AR]
MYLILAWRLCEIFPLPTSLPISLFIILDVVDVKVLVISPSLLPPSTRPPPTHRFFNLVRQCQLCCDVIPSFFSVIRTLYSYLTLDMYRFLAPSSGTFSDITVTLIGLHSQNKPMQFRTLVCAVRLSIRK